MKDKNGLNIITDFLCILKCMIISYFQLIAYYNNNYYHFQSVKPW